MLTHTFTQYIVFATVQNENVDREWTSEKLVVDMRRPDRRTPMKVRKVKTDHFRWQLWKKFCEQLRRESGHDMPQEETPE